MLRVALVTLFFFCMCTSSVFAVDEKEVPEYKQTRAKLYITSREAFDEIQAEENKILFLDVRTRAEVEVVGMPTVADANIPYMFMSEPMTWDDDWGSFKMTRNLNFLDAVKQRLEEKGLTQNDKVFLMCRSGGRSASAADLLGEAGFTNVYSVVDGYEGDKAKSGKRTLNGWKNSDLPWSYKLDKKKMYLPD
ncbi:MAG: rhodanese-like domain-containing protein [Proteobacteria bacterium]|nr:rhodanese-like domain-containing protein [Pseudomonadota bacterium]